MASAASWMVPVTSDARSERTASISAKIKPAGDVLRGIVEDRGHIDRQGAEHLVQVIGAILEVDGIDIERDRPRRVPGQGGDEFGMRCADGASGWTGLAGYIPGFCLAPLVPTQLEEGVFVVALDDPGAGAADDEASAIFVGSCPHARFHSFLQD